MAAKKVQTATTENGKKKLNAEEFKALFKDKTGPLIIRSVVVSEFVIIDADLYESRGLRLIDCEFLDGITFREVNFISGLHLVNCIVKDDFNIMSCKADSVATRREIASVANFAISNCQIDILTIEDETDLYKGLIISRGSKISSLTIMEVFSSYDKDRGITISGVEIDNYFDIDGLQSISRLRIDSCIVNCDIDIYTSRVTDFTIEGISKVKGEVKVTDCLFDSFVLFNSEFTSEVKTENLAVRDEIGLSGCSFQSAVTLDVRSSFIDTALDDDVESEAEPETWCIKLITIETSELSAEAIVFSADGTALDVDKLSVNCSSSLNGTIRFDNLDIERVSIGGNNSDFSILFQRSRFHHVQIDQFQNGGQLAFQSCCSTERADSSFETYDSNLGKTEFRNFLFQSFEKVIVSTSQWSEITYSATQWFNDDQLITITDPDPLIKRSDFFTDVELKREVYRQLKYASERQGDRVQALEFKAREHKAFREQVNFKNDWRSSNYWILKFNWTNDHGLNWIKPLCLTLVATALFYPFVLIDAAPDVHWTFEPTKAGIARLWNLGMDNWGVYWQMLNPARRTDIMLSSFLGEEGHPSALVYFLETLHRIILTFFVFQTISAFRKFVK